jgi:enediyne biosynthesis protein E4
MESISYLCPHMGVMRFPTLILLCIWIAGCADEARITDVNSVEYKLYEMVPSEHSNVDFINQLTETKYLNSNIFDAMVQGAGVGLLDVNNDGLEDIYFAGNQVYDQLYLNKGDLQFENITQKAGIRNTNTWSTGVTIADVNGDGWDDIYVCKFLFDEHEKRINLYYENQKNGTFKEKAAELGIADRGYSVMANFFDYDLDGDLDLYVANQPPNSIYLKNKVSQEDKPQFTDRLYQNQQGKFADVTEIAGIQNYSYSLSATVSDINGDDFVDIYVACDYEEPDLIYINQGNGTFRNAANEMLRHMSNFSMGSDIADINNDGYPDIFTADMVSEDHVRNKVNMGGMNPEKFWNLAHNGYHFQYMFNALQLNNGNGTFSEIAQMGGVSHTDWSWAGLFIDMDHDGKRDLFVTNGQLKEMSNRDWRIHRKAVVDEKARDANTDPHDILFDLSLKTPQQKLSNYVFHNDGDLRFTNVAKEWGLDAPTWSQGAVYGDLDNDGDLDLIISNSNEKAQIYENQTNDIKLNNYLVVQIDGPGANTRGLNAKARIRCGSNKQIAELTPVRGYMSSVQDVFHFGLGDNAVVDQLEIRWQDGKTWLGKNIKANQILKIKYKDARNTDSDTHKPQQVFTSVTSIEPVIHLESDYDDYAREILLPYKMSTLGPVVATGDVNGDGLEDFYLGGSAGIAGQLFLRSTSGTLQRIKNSVFASDASFEDGGAALMDYDGDGDLDLYVSSGSNEFDEGSAMYQDRLYTNDGKGNFSKTSSLPTIRQSTGAIVSLDFDDDGDLDLFVGARQTPGRYGIVPQSLLLQNDDGVFLDISREALPESGNLGMVTDGAWMDMNADGQSELVLLGDWMPISLLAWNGKTFENSHPAAFENTYGLWNTLNIGDVDADGDMDIIAGNLGMNNKYDASVEEPFKLYVNDFDGNGTHDVYLGSYDHGALYPVRGRDCSSQQMPFVKTKFASYTEFAELTVEEVLEGKMEGGIVHQAQMFESGIFYNQGNGNYEFIPFKGSAQVAPIYGIVMHDFNHDGRPDLLMGGNYYNREIETTRSDAGIGYLLMGQPEGGFKYIHPSHSGIIANGDVRDIFILRGDVPLIGIANNNAAMQFYRYK